MREDWTATLMRMAKPALLVAGILLTMRAAAAEKETHGLSAFGELKYPADFKHFEWVNPDAPKGGRLATDRHRRPHHASTASTTTFSRAMRPRGSTYLFDSLMTRAHDEPDAVYGLVARSARGGARPQLRSIFRLRPEAKFADGSALTAEDVVFTLNILKEKGHPIYRVQLKDVGKVEALDPHTVRYSFTGTQTRDLPLVVAGLPVFSKAYYATREFDQTSLEPPLGSGPYKIGELQARRLRQLQAPRRLLGQGPPRQPRPLQFRRVALRVLSRSHGRAREPQGRARSICARSSPRAIGSRATTSPPSRKAGWCKLTLPDESPSGAQGFFLNTRRPKLADLRVRKALDYAFDFEWTNKNIFYGLYTAHRELLRELRHEGDAASRAPEELALLEPFRAKLPPEVFEEPYKPPVSDGTGQGPQAAARGRPAARRGRLEGQGRQACRRQGRGARARVPDRRSRLRAHHHALRQEPAGARHRRQHPPHRPGAISSAASSRSTSTSSPPATPCA